MYDVGHMSSDVLRMGARVHTQPNVTQQVCACMCGFHDDDDVRVRACVCSFCMYLCV